MTPNELSKTRIIWSYILRLENASLLNWRAWAEDVMQEMRFVVPFWLCELSSAPSVQAALDCVRDGLGQEYADFAGDEIDEISLLFGLMYLRFARGKDSANEAWRVLREVGDVAEYIDSGHWRLFQKNREIDIVGSPLDARTSTIFRPVAAYALKTTREAFKKSVHLRTFLHRLCGLR